MDLVRVPLQLVRILCIAARVDASKPSPFGPPDYTSRTGTSQGVLLLEHAASGHVTDICPLLRLIPGSHSRCLANLQVRRSTCRQRLIHAGSIETILDNQYKLTDCALRPMASCRLKEFRLAGLQLNLILAVQSSQSATILSLGSERPISP